MSCTHGLSGWDCYVCGPSDAAIRKRYRKTEEYYRQAADLLDDFFGAELVASMSPEVRAAFDSLAAAIKATTTREPGL